MVLFHFIVFRQPNVSGCLKIVSSTKKFFSMLKQSTQIIILVLVFISGATQAAPFTEKQVYEYRQTMYQAGQDLNNNQSVAAFNKILPLAQQGFPEAQYIIGTMYQDGEGVAQNLTQAKYWYTQAAQQTTNRAVADLAQQELSDLP